MSVSEKYGIIILAAGESARLGRPKQLLEYDRQSLLKRVTRIAKDALDGPVIVVLGSQGELLQSEAEEKGVYTIINKDWKEGMGSSVRYGVKYVMDKFPAVTGLILAVCDQPFVSANLFEQLISAHELNHHLIVASEYDNTFGTPAFFDRSLFPELLELSGDRGAKQIMKKHPEKLGSVYFPLGSRDIDTEEDYQRLLKHNNDK